MLSRLVDNLLLVLSSGFQVEQPDKKVLLYTLHHNCDEGVNTLIVIGNLRFECDDFQFPINLIKSAGAIANRGDIFTSGVEQFLIVAPFSDSEYVTHAIHSKDLLANLPEWIVKYDASPQKFADYELWDIFVPIAELEKIAYKTFTNKING